MEDFYPQPALSSLSFTDAEIRFHYGNQIFSEPDSINKSAAFSSWHGKKNEAPCILYVHLQVYYLRVDYIFIS